MNNLKKRIFWIILLLLIEGCLGLMSAANAGIPSVNLLRDPTEPPDDLDWDGSAGNIKGGLLLTTILCSPQRKLAIINDHIVQAGEKIGNVEILAITPNAVWVRDQNQPDQELMLTLMHQPIRL